ncbi:MAG: phage baseplate assembly protein V, partial [Lewinella sp.]
SLYATNGKGSFILPEVGDEVFLGFLNDDPRFAIILGSAYSSKNPPPYTADKENSIKALVTRNDLKIELNDKDKVLTISTPAGNTFTLSDKDRSITVEDQNSNKVTMDSSGITLKSPKDITIDAGGKLTLKARQQVNVTSTGGDVSLKGLNVKADGKVGATVKGGASAELSAGGQTTVKGAMVMIN